MIQATGVRIAWRDLPAPVRARIEDVIGGGPVVEAHSQAGGFSPGTADRVLTASGRRAFVKAVTPALNPRSAELARQEMRITAALPERAPVPRMLGGFDDGDWVVLVLEDVDGTHPRTPWTRTEIDAAVRGLRELAEALTPSPLADAPHAADRLGANFTGWDQLAADPPGDLDPWANRHLDVLGAAAKRGLVALRAGATLTHCDIRADNILVRRDGRMVFVDWPWACIGPAWLDTLLLGANVLVYGGDADIVFAGIDPSVVTDVVAGFAGFLQYAGRLPPPPGLPTVRAFARFQGEALVPWLRTRFTR
jgi:aminoglycoside phosphotransferase (APT) family kinase protein